MLQYASCLVYLGCEMVICSAIILPLPQKFRRTILESISSVWNSQPRVRWFIKFLNLIIFGMFCDSAWGVYRSYLVTDITHPHIADAMPDQAKGGKGVAVNLYESERNMIMSLFILFLFMLIYRFQSMIHQVVVLERELGSDDKFATQDAKFKKLTVQNEELQRELEKRGVPVVNYEATTATQ